MNTDTTTSTACPTCAGPRTNAERVDLLAVFDHGDGCGLAAAELDGHMVDRARRDKHGTAVRHRPVTPAEATLLRASGIALDARAPTFARVSWAGELRTRTWTGIGLTACDAMVGAT